MITKINYIYTVISLTSNRILSDAKELGFLHLMIKHDRTLHVRWDVVMGSAFAVWLTQVFET